MSWLTISGLVIRGKMAAEYRAARCRESVEILSGNRGLLTATQPQGLVYHARWLVIKSVAMAVWADTGSRTYNRVTALAYFVAAGIVGNFLGFIESGLMLWS